MIKSVFYVFTFFSQGSIPNIYSTGLYPKNVDGYRRLHASRNVGKCSLWALVHGAFPLPFLLAIQCNGLCRPTEPKVAHLS